MTEKIVCQACGATLGNGAPEGLCPACLLGAGLMAPDAEVSGELDLIAEKPGDLVGRYRLLEKAGEGGFGVVFRAEQDKPVRRVVALKVVKPGMDSKEVVMRFEAERQALAVMDHSSIAKVYDAGMTERGRPYFVMEFVEGHPLTDFCDEEGLELRERLALFARICDAVQHAHQKGVVHRDLKPGNIMVTKGSDGVPFPKVIDFGVAKAISIELTEKTFFTVFGRLVGTPQYMSPEQAELNAVDVDTRSDIYSLGVILYELVTGRAPLEEKDLAAVGYDEMRRMIREVVPPKPSSRLMTLPENERRALAKSRGFDPARYRRRVSGDLDWVVMKALEKDRERRYDSAHGLGADVQNYLEGLPVVAGPPSAFYRVRKFVQRNRGPAIAFALAVLALIGATVGTARLQRATEIARNKSEERRLNGLVEGVKNRRKDEQDSRGKALEELREIGRYVLSTIEMDDDAAQNLRNRARNELIACVAWTDLQKQVLLKDVQSPWVQAALDASQERCVMSFPDGRLEVRDASDGAVLNTRDAPSDPGEVGGIEFVSDGELVAARFGTAESWELALWNWQSGEDVANVSGGPGGFAFDPTGSMFVVGTRTGTLKVYKSDGTELRELPAPAGVPVALGISRTGRLAIGLKGSGIVILDGTTGMSEDQWSGLDPASLEWAPDGKSIVVGGADGSVTVVEGGVASPIFRDREHSAAVDHVAWSHDGRFFASGSPDEMIRLWDGRQGELLCKYRALARTLRFSGDDLSLGPVLFDQTTLGVLKIQRSPVCHRASGHRGEKIAASVWSPDMTMLATAAGDGLRIWNRHATQLQHFPDLKVRPGGLAWSHGQLYFAEKAAISRMPIAVVGGRIQCGAPELFSPLSGGNQIVLDPNGKFLAVACDQEVVLLDLASGTVTDRKESLASTAFLAISPDGNWLAASPSAGKGVRIWDLGSTTSGIWNLGGIGPATVAFYPRPGPGPFLMTGDENAYKLWRWDAARKDWVGHREHDSGMANLQGRMAQMAFSPRGTAVIISYDNKYLRVLHPIELIEMAQPSFDEQWPLTVSPDGRMMATEAANGRLFIWNLAEARDELAIGGLDWEGLDPFPVDKIPIVDPPATTP